MSVDHSVETLLAHLGADVGRTFGVQQKGPSASAREGRERRRHRAPGHFPT